MVGQQHQRAADESAPSAPQPQRLGQPLVDRPSPPGRRTPRRPARRAGGGFEVPAPTARGPAAGGVGRGARGEGGEQSRLARRAFARTDCSAGIQRAVAAAQSSRATSSSVAVLGERTGVLAAIPEPSRRATVVIAEASTGSPQAMASSATSAALRPRALRWASARDVGGAIEAAARIAGVRLRLDAGRG